MHLSPTTAVHLSRFNAAGRTHVHCDLASVLGAARLSTLPWVARVLAENLLRNIGRPGVDEAVLAALCDPAVGPDAVALPLYVPRIILPDSSGVPVLMDLAALRDAVARSGGDPAAVDAAVPIAFIIDHSLQVDHAARPDAPALNLAREFERNGERYSFIKWAQQAFGGVRIYPPSTGIIHQIHLEQEASVTRVEDTAHGPLAYPDFAIGGDSHTPMINALGVLGWGVGGIEAETVALGEAYVLPKPEFVGVRLWGRLSPGITMTDAALHATRVLRDAGVVGAFIEFFGPAAANLSVPDRATLANMAPEYGATTGFWPIDERTLDYLRLTGRPPEQVALVEAHARAANLFRDASAPDPVYDRIIDIDLSKIGRTLAGPAKPHARQTPSSAADSFKTRHPASSAASDALPYGAVVIAAITSCTNTANPAGMMRAGLLARNARARGLTPPAWVKTSLAPGSRAVTAYLDKAGLLADLEHLGFGVIGYGCTTCGGKSGPLAPDVVAAIETAKVPVAAVLSGNRNFDGRIHRLVSASYLASPALVVAYALAGRIVDDIDTITLGRDVNGRDVTLADLWPADDEVEAAVARHVTPDLFRAAAVLSPDARDAWAAVPSPTGLRYAWDDASTYIVAPPFFEVPQNPFATSPAVAGARVLGIYADGLTTDHVSPGGEIPADSPAGQYLQSRGIPPPKFNSYVGRRGNHHVHMRATYANVRIQNRMVPEREGWWTRLHPGGDVVTVYDASASYLARGVPLVVIGARDFGSGSSRDWAAKGPVLLGVGAIIANSYERIHRSNLIGVGILPLVFANGGSADALGLDGSETYAFSGLDGGLDGRADIAVTATRVDGASRTFRVRADVRSAAEADLLRRGGVFKSALARFIPG